MSSHTPDRAFRFRSHGDGRVSSDDFARTGERVVLEPGVLVFHPETVFLGSEIYVGHRTILHGYPSGELIIEDGVWIGPNCYLHAAGGIAIGEEVGIGPGVTVVTSQHRPENSRDAVMSGPLELAPVRIEGGADIGASALLLPGATIGRGAIVGAGSVVVRDVPGFEVWAGNPARRIGERPR